MDGKIFEIERKWEKGVDNGNLDAGDLFSQLIDVAYSLDSRKRLKEKLINYELKMYSTTNEEAEKKVDTYLKMVN